jgi:hypothetical protein
VPTQLQLEGPDLESLLARVKTELGPGARIVLAEKVRTGGLAGFFAKQTFAITVEVDEAAAPAAPAPAAPASLLDLADRISDSERAATHVSTETTGFAAVLARLGATTGTAPDPAATPAPAAPPAPAPVTASRPMVPAPRAPEGSSTPPAIELRRQVPAPVQPAPVTGQLARLGLPGHLQPAGSGKALYPALVESLRTLPKAPRTPNRAGTVLAVVGPMAQSLEAARGLAKELKLPAGTAVVLATSRRALTDLAERQVLRDVEQAETRRAGWRRRRNLTIVAVDAPLTAAGAAQARAYLAVLQPAATWGAVEATRKAHDVGAFARAVGGLDALALSAVEETADPAAVLQLGIPVGRLGERRATPSAWASLLTSRLAA